MKGCLQFLKIEFDGIFVIKFNRVGPNAMSSHIKRFLSLPYKPSLLCFGCLQNIVLKEEISALKHSQQWS